MSPRTGWLVWLRDGCWLYSPCRVGRHLLACVKSMFTSLCGRPSCLVHPHRRTERQRTRRRGRESRTKTLLVVQKVALKSGNISVDAARGKRRRMAHGPGLWTTNHGLVHGWSRDCRFQCCLPVATLGWSKLANAQMIDALQSRSLSAHSRARQVLRPGNTSKHCSGSETTPAYAADCRSRNTEYSSATVARGSGSESRCDKKTANVHSDVASTAEVAGGNVDVEGAQIADMCMREHITNRDAS